MLSTMDSPAFPLLFSILSRILFPTSKPKIVIWGSSFSLSPYDSAYLRRTSGKSMSEDKTERRSVPFSVSNTTASGFSSPAIIINNTRILRFGEIQKSSRRAWPKYYMRKGRNACVPALLDIQPVGGHDATYPNPHSVSETIVQ